ncbi:MAG: AAA family ATPase [Bdellovibrionia bacterium]
MRFTWIGFFEEMLAVVCRDYDSKSLAQLAHELFPSAPLKDQYKDGTSSPVKEFDPLTFIGYFNRALTDDKRIALCELAKEKLKLKADVPSDFTGIPIINNQASWFFPYAKNRTDDVFLRLWAFAKALNTDSINEHIFSDALNVNGVGIAKLTQLCFFCKSSKYLPLDKNTTEYLKNNGLEKEVTDVRKSEKWSAYTKLLTAIGEKFPGKPFAEISAGAFSMAHYWVLGATWGKDEDKAAEFIKNGEWVNGFSVESGDKSIEKVKRIDVGDWVAIKSAFTKQKKISCIRVKAVGQVTENTGDGRHLKVNWVFTGPAFDVDGAAYMRTVHNVDDPVDRKLIFENGYKSSQKETKSDATPRESSSELSDLPKNLILYGPPGVGKTHKILGLRKMFTSSSNVQDSTRIANWISEMPWWKVVVAVMIDLNRTVSVAEIEAHPFLQAKIKQSSNKTPKNTIWAWLQTHTVESSKTVKFQKRIEPLVFDKNEESQWFLTGDWEESFFFLKDEIKKLKSGASDEVRRYDVVTFHQSYSYEDFIEGIRPKTDEATDSISYEIEGGVFKRICEKAKGDPENDYALFIDEINRGNIAKIFGEIITLIEEDKRAGASNHTTVTLPYSKTEFCIPQNLYIIGTMNSVDRSIALLDMALRRRFRFQRICPDPELVVAEVEGINFRAIFNELNDRISVIMGEDYQLGHSYFMHDKIETLAALKSVWFENIVPLFQEYFFDDWEKIQILIPSFVQTVEIKGLENLGLINTKKYGFVSSQMSEDDFAKRLNELATFLKTA